MDDTTTTTTEFDEPFGPGHLGLDIESDLFKKNAIVKHVSPNSIAASHERIKPGLVIIGVNGKSIQDIGFDIALSKIQEASRSRTMSNKMILRFRLASVHFKDERTSLSPVRNRSKSIPSITMDESLNELRERAVKFEKKHSVTAESYEATIESLTKQLRHERAINERGKSKIQMLVCNQQLLSSGAIRQASDAHIIYALRLLALAFVLSAISAFLPEHSVALLVASFGIPQGFAIDEWFSVIVAGMLTYAHFYLAMCQAQDRRGWTSGSGFVFVMLLFLLNEGHGVYLATSALDESQRDMFAGLHAADKVNFVVCIQSNGDFTQTCRSDGLTWPLVYFLRENFSNYLFYGANLGLMYFSLYLETKHTDINSSAVHSLSRDLKFTVCSIHGISLAVMAISDHIVWLTIIFCLFVLKQSSFRFSSNQLVLTYFSRVALVTLASIMVWHWFHLSRVAIITATVIGAWNWFN